MQACHTTVAHALQQMHYNVVTTEDFLVIAQEHPSSQDRSSSQGHDRAPFGGFISPPFFPTTNSGELHQTQDRDLTSTLDQCLAAIVNCDLYLGLFAQHHVSNPQANNPPSLAEQLYRKAVQLNKPRLIFLPAQDASWSPNRVAPPLADDHPKHSL